MIELLKERLKAEEGFSLKWYPDINGFLTGGYGHKATKEDNTKKGKTKTEWEEIFDIDVLKVLMGLKTFVYRDIYKKLSDIRQLVIADMAYQMGINGVIKFKKMWAALKFGDYPNAMREMLKSDWFKQTPERAEQLAYIMFTDFYQEYYAI
jgi:lysozyme